MKESVIVVDLVIMKVATLLALLIFSVVCNYCGKDFISLGRHSWRCKSKIPNQQDRNHDNGENFENRNNVELPDVQVNDVSISNTDNVLCTCGKSCKGLRSLKVINDLVVLLSH